MAELSGFSVTCRLAVSNNEPNHCQFKLTDLLSKVPPIETQARNCFDPYKFMKRMVFKNNRRAYLATFSFFVNCCCVSDVPISSQKT